ncbi:hypothetical protein chiPu_0027346, partial [Chiloscyllium punctatum]|nr:hypothetical protein [Chiloscyllium punctatum]
MTGTPRTQSAHQVPGAEIVRGHWEAKRSSSRELWGKSFPKNTNMSSAAPPSFRVGKTAR